MNLFGFKNNGALEPSHRIFIGDFWPPIMVSGVISRICMTGMGLGAFTMVNGRY